MSDVLEGAVCGVDGCIPAAFDQVGPASGAKTMLAIEVISDAICPWCWVAKRRLDSAIVADGGASAGLDRARILAMLASDEGQAEMRSELRRAMNLGVSGVPTVLVDGVPLFSGAIRAELMEAELRKAAGHVRS